MKFFDPDFLNFFIELAANNHKEWFDTNRKRYEKSVKKPFENFIEHVITEIQKYDSSIQIPAKDAIFRINRDIRFSKDKSPYKLDRTAIISKKGRKDHSAPGFYLSLGPEKMMLGGGAYFMRPPQLAKLRNYIMVHPKKFNKAINDNGFIEKFKNLQGEENKRLPNKEMTRAAENMPLLYKKQMYYMADLDANTILSSHLMDVVTEYYLAAKPVESFLTEAMA